VRNPSKNLKGPRTGFFGFVAFLFVRVPGHQNQKTRPKGVGRVFSRTGFGPVLGDREGGLNTCHNRRRMRRNTELLYKFEFCTERGMSQQQKNPFGFRGNRRGFSVVGCAGGGGTHATPRTTIPPQNERKKTPKNPTAPHKKNLRTATFLRKKDLTPLLRPVDNRRAFFCTTSFFLSQKVVVLSANRRPRNLSHRFPYE
jgi:hypothetical protein